MTVTVRYWAAAREAAGLAEEQLDASSLAELLAGAASTHGAALAAVLERCAFVVDEMPVGKRDHAAVVLPVGAVVEVLPPFAGG